jgi:hypothetical protein
LRAPETLSWVNAQTFLAQQRGHDVVHVLDAPFVEVAGLVHVEDLAVEVPDGGEVLALQGGLELFEDLVEVLLESGSRQEIEHKARQEQGDHPAGRQGDGLTAGAGHETPDLPLIDGLVVQGLARLPESVDVADRGSQTDAEALGDVVRGQTLGGIERGAHVQEAGGGCVRVRLGFPGHGQVLDHQCPLLSWVGG